MASGCFLACGCSILILRIVDDIKELNGGVGESKQKDSCCIIEYNVGEVGILMPDYKEELNEHYSNYRRIRFPNSNDVFDLKYENDRNPPVFLSEEAWRNIIIDPDANQQAIDELIALLPEGERHRWYRSMNSSQALAHSIFGNLLIHGHMNCLLELKDENGLNLFGEDMITADNFKMEHKVSYLGEPRPTTLDGFISGPHKIAIECKFTEQEVGMCSRPGLRPIVSNYEKDHCDRTYSVQRGRKERCSLTEIGVQYWKYVPLLFNWDNDEDIDPCPLYMNYQLVRNVLAAGVRPNGTASPDYGHVVLVYDERNPAFLEEGNVDLAYRMVQSGLKEPSMLRKCSWQQITQHLREQSILPWLTKDLELKYGL